MKLNIEYLPLGDIKPYAGNAKLHPAEQIEQIKNSIQRFGFNDPIAIWKDEIVEGHGRFIAAQELGIEEVPVIRLDDMSDKERKAYMIAHNKLTMNTGFDNEMLKEELNSILDDFDMTDFGFGDFELSILTGDFEPEEYDKELVEEYSSNEDQFLEKKRVIITYKSEQEDAVKELLGLDEISKVVYDISEVTA